jgi:hypothetical protein
LGAGSIWAINKFMPKESTVSKTTPTEGTETPPPPPPPPPPPIGVNDINNQGWIEKIDSKNISGWSANGITPKAVDIYIDNRKYIVTPTLVREDVLLGLNPTNKNFGWTFDIPETAANTSEGNHQVRVLFSGTQMALSSNLPLFYVVENLTISIKSIFNDFYSLCVVSLLVTNNSSKAITIKDINLVGKKKPNGFNDYFTLFDGLISDGGIVDYYNTFTFVIPPNSSKTYNCEIGFNTIPIGSFGSYSYQMALAAFNQNPSTENNIRLSQVLVHHSHYPLLSKNFLDGQYVLDESNHKKIFTTMTFDLLVKITYNNNQTITNQ